MEYIITDTPETEIHERITKLQSHLEEQKFDGALILQNTDLFYFAGTIQQSYLYIPAKGDPILMVRKHVERALAESGIEHIVTAKSPKNIPKLLRKNGYDLPQTLGLECDVLPANLYFAYQEIFNGTTLKDISSSIRLIRAVKSPLEVNLIRQAASFADEIAGVAKNIIQEGMTEIELAGKIEAEARRLGHQGIVRMRVWGGELFYGHLMAGPSAAVPSYLASPTGGTGVSSAVAQGPGFQPIKRNQPILVDYVFVYNGYLADHTRIFTIEGLPDTLMAAHDAMLGVQKIVQKEAKPGIEAGKLYGMAFEYAKTLGYEDNFMGIGPERVRFVGHGIGLELDEYPVLAEGQKLPLQAGMVVALEPKLIFPGKGVVGIENTHVVTNTGLEQLTTFPDEIVIL